MAAFADGGYPGRPDGAREATTATFMSILTSKRAAHALAGAAILLGAGAGGAGAATAKLDQSITVTVHAPAAAAYDDSFAVAARSSSGSPVSFSSSGACSNSGATFTMTSGAGTCLVKYDQPGDGTYNAAPQLVESVAAQKADQEITFDPLDDGTFGDPDFDVDAFAPSGLDVTFAASGDCTLSGTTVHITGAGSCTVTASQAGDANFNAAPAVPQSFAIAKADQEIIFDPLQHKAYGDPDFTVGATADSELPVSFTAKGKCTVRGVRVHLTGAGSCTVTASQPGNANYNAAEDVSQSFSITAPSCSVPRVTGKRLAAAKLAIAQDHCRTGKVSYASSRRNAKGRVISQSRRPGRTLPVNTKISLVLGRGR
jgi:hypothetical protein